MLAEPFAIPSYIAHSLLAGLLDLPWFSSYSTVHGWLATAGWEPWVDLAVAGTYLWLAVASCSWVGCGCSRLELDMDHTAACWGSRMFGYTWHVRWPIVFQGQTPKCIDAANGTLKGCFSFWCERPCFKQVAALCSCVWDGSSGVTPAHIAHCSCAEGSIAACRVSPHICMWTIA